MNLRNTTLTYMSRWPLLFQRPDQVFDHLFLTIGNGCVWKSGQLVENGRGTHPFLNKVFVSLKEEIDQTSIALNESKLRCAILRECKIELHRRTRKKVLAQLVELRIRPLATYPISRVHAPAAHVPDDVRPDWLAGVHWMLDFILSGRFTVANVDSFDETDPAGFVRRQKAAARKMKRELDRRFPASLWADEASRLQKFIDKVEAHKEIARYRETWERCGIFEARPKGNKP